MRETLLAVALALAIVPVATESAAGTLTIGLIPSEDEEITESLAEGVRFALEMAALDGGPEIELVVGSNPTHWSTASLAAIQLAFGTDVVALLTPPDRRTAHLVAQIGSRAHIPVLATTTAPSIGDTGSYWVVPVGRKGDEDDEATPPAIDLSGPGDLRLSTDFRSRYGRDLDGWAAIGYRAAAALCDAVQVNGLDGRLIARGLQAVAFD